MKTKKMCMLVVLFAVFSFVIIPTGAYAADISSASITRIGFYPNITEESSGAIVFLTDNSATPAWAGSRMFYISTDLGNEGLATLLTAYSMGKTLWVRLGGTAAGSLVTIIYIND